MRLKGEFVVRRVADKNVAIPIDSVSSGFNAMLTLNESGAFIFEYLKEDTDLEKLVSAFLDEYDATREQAENTIKKFIERLKEQNLIIE